MNSTEALVEERGKTHGNPDKVYGLVWDMWSSLLADDKFKELPGWLKVEHMLILFKVGRAAHNPHVMDNYADIRGYSLIAEQGIERMKKKSK